MPTDPDNSTEKPSWDGTQLALATFLEKLERWLYKKNPDYRSFLEEGYIINRRDVVPTEFHAGLPRWPSCKGVPRAASEQIFVDYELLPGWVELRDDDGIKVAMALCRRTSQQLVEDAMTHHLRPFVRTYMRTWQTFTKPLEEPSFFSFEHDHESQALDVAMFHAQ